MRKVLGSRKLFRAISLICAISVFVACLPAQSFAARSRAGGGDLAKFDTGAFLTSTAINVGSTLLTAGMSGGWDSASKAAKATADVGKIGRNISTLGELVTNPSHIATGFKQLTSLHSVLPVVGKGFATAVAVNQVGGAIGAYGTYKGWKPSQIYLASTIAGAAVGSFINPDVALGRPVEGVPTASLATPINPAKFSTMAKGAFVGTLEGTAKGLTVYAIDRKRIDKGKEPSALGQIAGMTTGMMATGFARELFYPAPSVEAVFKANSNTNTYQKITHSPKNIIGGETLSGNSLTTEDIENVYPSPDYIKQSGDSSILKVIEVSPGRPHLFRASVVETFDRWPSIATKGVSIALTQKLGKDKQYLAPLVGGLTNAIVEPMLQNAADILSSELRDIHEDFYLYIPPRN